MLIQGGQEDYWQPYSKNVLEIHVNMILLTLMLLLVLYYKIIYKQFFSYLQTQTGLAIASCSTSGAARALPAGKSQHFCQNN